jgi:hypothetical protein
MKKDWFTDAERRLLNGEISVVRMATGKQPRVMSLISHYWEEIGHGRSGDDTHRVGIRRKKSITET